MQVQIDDNIIANLEDLSNLALTQDEKSQLKGDLQDILNGLAVIDKLDTVGVPECRHPLDNVNIFREDEVQPSFDRELILQNAPMHNGQMIIAPRTVE